MLNFFCFFLNHLKKQLSFLISVMNNFSSKIQILVLSNYWSQDQTHFGYIHEGWASLQIVFLFLTCVCMPSHLVMFDFSPSGSSVHMIFQARILEWIAIPFSSWSSQPRNWTWVEGSCLPQNGEAGILDEWFTRCDLSNSASAPPGEMLGMQNITPLSLPPTPTHTPDLLSLGVGGQNPAVSV